MKDPNHTSSSCHCMKMQMWMKWPSPHLSLVTLVHRGHADFYVSELWDHPQLRRLTFSSRLTSTWLLFSSAFGLSSSQPRLPLCSVSAVYPPPLLLLLSLLCPLFPPFSRRPGSGVTNYSKRAEKVAWALPSGLPCCINVTEPPETQQPLAASTAASASASGRTLALLMPEKTDPRPPHAWEDGALCLLTDLLGSTNMYVWTAKSFTERSLCQLGWCSPTFSYWRMCILVIDVVHGKNQITARVEGRRKSRSEGRKVYLCKRKDTIYDRSAAFN